jgi:ssDNA-binding replication factor A large subunit
MSKLQQLYNDLDMFEFEREYLEYSINYHYNARLSCWTQYERVMAIEEMEEEVKELKESIKHFRKKIIEEERALGVYEENEYSIIDKFYEEEGDYECADYEYAN